MNTAVEEFSIVDEIAEQHREDMIEVYEVVRDICQRDGKSTHANLVYFKQKADWDKNTVQARLRDMNNVLRLQAIAGRSADRQASVKESETAAAVLETEGPKLIAKIEKLRQSLDALERDARLSAKRVTEQAEAAEALRALAPENIAGSVRSAVQTIKGSLGREIGDAEVRANELRCCLTPSLYKNEGDWMEVLARSFGAAVIVESINRVIRRQLSPAWPGIKASIETELTELHPKLAELRAQYAEQITAAEAPLSYYAS